MLGARRVVLIGVAAGWLASAGPAGAAASNPDRTPDAAASAPGPAGPASSAAGPFLGVVVPDSMVDLSPKYDARLERLEVKVGDAVRRGQVLARLDTRAVAEDLAAARAQLQAARADEQAALAAVSDAREKKQRMDTPRLAKLGVFSKEELEGVRLQERSATAKLEAARAQARERQAHVVEMEQRLSEATLVAPFDGVVAACPVSAGARVAAGQPVVRVNGSGGLQVRFAMPEEAGRKLSAGAPLEVLSASAANPLAGVVQSVAPEVDAAARMVFALATFDQPPPEQLTPGAVVRVRAVVPGAGGLARGSEAASAR